MFWKKLQKFNLTGYICTSKRGCHKLSVRLDILNKWMIHYKITKPNDKLCKKKIPKKPRALKSTEIPNQSQNMRGGGNDPIICEII